MDRLLRRRKESGQQKKNGGGQAGKEAESFHDTKLGHLMECMTEEGKASVEHHSNRNPNPPTVAFQQMNATGLLHLRERVIERLHRPQLRCKKFGRPVRKSRCAGMLGI
ncbi:MAG TPA: hypothetical protein PKV67_17415 [Hyphomonas sp.]|nr:hypothetical protein [Hyphomonas sp.]HRJ46512.1 hypothetical protein [Opitutaceae bacterium]